MGYKYGLWYIYSNDVFNTTHISHFTVSCFMNINDAYNLYNEIYNYYGNINVISVYCKDPVIFDNNMYKDDVNNLYSWGYYGNIMYWNDICNIVQKYNCNFTNDNHTTVQYSTNKNLLNLKSCNKNEFLICKLVIVDMNDDNPNNWKIIFNQ